jgi:hypothetical protein
MQPCLAAFLSELLFEGDYSLRGMRSAGSRAACAMAASAMLLGEVVKSANGQAPRDEASAGCSSILAKHFDFVAVPSAVEGGPARSDLGAAKPKGANGRRAPASRRPAVKGGAGLELDLASPIHLGRLPTELRGELPSRGLVNYLEAQAIVRALETLWGDPRSRERLLAWETEMEWAWRPGRGAPSRAASARSNPAIAVIALYSAQAKLIECLLNRSSVLASRGAEIEVGAPSVFRQREACLVMLGLTRSHSHRAVTFGEDPDSLALALTRARACSIVFGDPGTLRRRCQWDGPLDHLDEFEAERERRIVARLLRIGDEPQGHAASTHCREGAGA